MKKAILVIVVLLIVAIGGGVYYVLTNLDHLVKTAIEKYGSEAVKTSVRVDSVKVKLADGDAAIRGLTVANPDGFSYPHAFSLGEIGVDLNLEKISQELVAIDKINIEAPEVYFEINADRKGNLNVLKDNIGGGGASKPAEAQPQASGGKQIKLHIAKFIFKDAKLKAKIVPLKDKTYDLKLPTLTLNNLNGTPEQVSKQVMNQLIDHAKAEIKRKGLDKELAELKAKAKEKVDEKKAELKAKTDAKVDAERKKAEDKLKGLLGR